MTNHWNDIKNSKLVMVLGANPAENHPIAMQHINTARKPVSEGGQAAKLVVVDPRRTRIAGMADQHLRIRPGTNGGLMQGLIRYAIENNRYDEAYISQRIATRQFWGKRSDTGAYEKTALTAAATQNGAVLTGGWPMRTDVMFKLNPSRNDYERANVTVNKGTYDVVFENMPVVLSDWKTNPDSVWSVMKQRASSYDAAEVAKICDTTVSEFNSMAAIITDPANRPGTILYAMGGTQFTHASQDLRAYCMLQLLLGNMGVAGGGVNALRGIHNVQGSTDMGVLFSSMPGYSDVPTVTAGVPQTYTDYMNKLFGDPKYTSKGTGDTLGFWRGLQQRGFRNMMHWYFRQNTNPVNAEDATGDNNSNFDLLPKGAGLHHVQMFRNMRSSTAPADKVKMLFVLGQNPAVTEPNLPLVKQGLNDLETLVVTDIFESETAGCPRSGVTYFLPAASFVEEAGSVTNSSRWIQWREKAIDPKGGSKSDTEILLTLAKTLDDAGAFNHLPLPSGYSDRYSGLYGSQYGWTPSSAFDAAVVAENMFRQMASDDVDGVTGATDWGSLWIYRGAWHAAGVAEWGAPAANWTNPTNKAKSRNGTYDSSGGKELYPCWGWAWLHNRRVFYNMGLVAGDQGDLFVAPDQVARFFVHHKNDATAVCDYTWFYRNYSKLADVNSGDGSTCVAVEGARMPKHWESHETPRIDLRDKYGTTGDAATIDTRGDRTLPTKFPLVLTTIRVTEHFQGGPTTRNIPWLCELVPEAFIEINSADASAAGISKGQNVYIDTPRASNIGPFKAIVGSGLAAQQRVKKGVVAIPWHWGNKGISTGPSANELTVDALDMNIKMPEFKTCLCKIHK